MNKETPAETIFYAIIFLFFFQLLSDFIAAVYAFGLLGVSIPVEIVSVLFVFSPVLLFFFKRISATALVVIGILFLLARATEPLFDTRGRMLLSGFGVSCFLILFPGLIFQSRDKKDFAETAGAGLVLALCCLILLKTVFSGFDVSNHGWFQIINWIFAAIASFILFKLKFPGDIDKQEGKSQRGTSLICISLISVFTLIYFAFGSPHVIVRWTGESHLLVLGSFLIAISASLFLQQFFSEIPGKLLVFMNLLFVASLSATIYSNQTHFPNSVAEFPVYQTENTIFHKIFLLVALISSPVILLDFRLFLTKLSHEKITLPGLATGFSFSALFLLVMIFTNIFTTVYSYIPVIGEFFRDKYWLVFLVTALPLAVTSFRFLDEKIKFASASKNLTKVVIALSVVTILIAVCTEAKPSAPASFPEKLKILSFNIQQGYDADGQLNYAGQLGLLQKAGADIIGLQETDIARISGGNTDIVRYFADNLNMHSYYGPKTVTGTFGLALLSKYPIMDARTFYMPGAGEQTATIGANIQVGGKVVRVFNTHLGNGGPLIQQQTILKEIRNLKNVILMGDFNFESGARQYRVTTQKLTDAYTQIDSAKFVRHRIDYIFLSPQIKVEDMQYVERQASDHPAVLLTIPFE